MREAAKYFIGKHDFTSFENASHNDRVPDPVKHIFRFDVKEMVEFFPTTVSIISILHKIFHVCSIFLVYFL
jgi:tRNA U38,U39,U40 pseudouridine synthase TruA